MLLICLCIFLLTLVVFFWYYSPSQVASRNNRTIHMCLQGDEKVIQSVFQNRKEELLSMQRYTVEVTIYVSLKTRREKTHMDMNIYIE